MHANLLPFLPLLDSRLHRITIGVRAIFGGGWIDFARKICGSARKMDSRTIKKDDTRKLDYIDCGKSLKNLYLHLHCFYIVFYHQYSLNMLPEKLLDCPKKNYFARLWGLQPPSSYAYADHPRFTYSLKSLIFYLSSLQIWQEVCMGWHCKPPTCGAQRKWQPVAEFGGEQIHMVANDLQSHVT